MSSIRVATATLDPISRLPKGDDVGAVWTSPRSSSLRPRVPAEQVGAIVECKGGARVAYVRYRMPSMFPRLFAPSGRAYLYMSRSFIGLLTETSLVTQLDEDARATAGAAAGLRVATTAGLSGMLVVVPTASARAVGPAMRGREVRVLVARGARGTPPGFDRRGHPRVARGARHAFTVVAPSDKAEAIGQTLRTLVPS